MNCKWVLAVWILTVAACSSPPQTEQAQPAKQVEQAEAEASDVVELLFVQNAAGVEFGDGTMKLTGVNPTTLYFSDRPHRIAGHVKLESFLYTVSQLGTFRDSPPNAVLVMLAEEGIQDVVMVITERPTLVGDTLSFAIRILEGDPPVSASAVSLFIDSAGQPDVWQTPATAPRNYEQPGTMSRNVAQPGTVARNAAQPGTVARDAPQPGELGPDDYARSGESAADAYATGGAYGARGRFDVRGPSDSRGQK
jgi:hypothetical protein